MKILKDERLVINVIKYGPIAFVIIFAFFITEVFIYEKNLNFKKEIKLVEKSYLENNKKRVKNEIQRIYREIKEEKEQSEKLLKKMIKSRVYEAHNIATKIYKEETNLEEGHYHSKEHIFNTIKLALEGIIYNQGRGYFFINDIDGFNRLQPLNKKIEDTNILELKDVNGYSFMRTINQSIKDKTEKFDTYYWYKNDQDKTPYKKISFYKYFEPYNISIGTGEYIQDFETEMKEKILERINKVRFDKTGYIFIFDTEGNALSHYNKYEIGINRLNEKDEDGKFFIKDIINHAKNYKQGFVSYNIKFKPNAVSKNRQKTSYVKLLKDWNWVIGTGFYLDNLNKEIEDRKILLEKSMNKSIKQIILISLIVTLFFVILSFYISRIISKRLIEYKKNLEKQIFENLEQKETLLEAQKVAKIGNWKLNPFTNIAEWSEEITNILGITTNEVALSPEFMKTILVEDDINKFEKFLKKCMIKDKQNKTIVRIFRPNNEVRWLDCRGKLDHNKNIIIGTLQDITESKKLEIENKAKEELLYQQSKLAAMGEMLANIAHQWRQPLSAISVTATGAKIQKEMNIFNDNDFYSTMDTINDSAQYLSNTIDDFRGFFDPKNKIKKEFNISNTIDKTLNLLSSQFKTKDIEFINNIEDFKIESFENELIQVLMNIINNSKDALVPLTEQKQFIFIKTYQKNNKSYIEIYDNANGISESIINRIFEPYFTTKHQSQGTGIGLYMSQDIVKNSLKGKLHAQNYTYIFDNIQYTGAKFTIIL